MELYSFDPFDEERADLRNGMLMALLANKDRDKRKRPTPFTFKEFMPYRDKVSQPLPVQAETGQGARVDSNALTYFFIAAGETLPEELE